MQEQEVAKIEVGDGAAIPTPDDRGLVSAWWIALIGAVALLVLLPVIKPDPTSTSSASSLTASSSPSR